MKKRYLCLALALLLCALSGCTGKAGEVRAVDGIYASCGNYNFTIYRGLSPAVSIRFYLTCEKPLPENTEIQIDMEAEFGYEILDVTPKTLTQSDYPYGLYCCARGFDWKKLKKLENALEKAKQAYLQNPKKLEDYNKAQQTLEEYQNQYLEDYQAMMAQNPVPEFHQYLVDIRCTDATGEPEIQEVTLSSGDWSHTVKVGSVKVREASWPVPHSLKVTGHRLAVQGGAFGPWYPGAMPVDAIEFDVDEDVTLTNAYFYGDTTAKVLRMDLTVTNGDNEVQTQWKPGDSLQLRAGETVKGVVYYTDKELASAEYGTSLVFMLEFDGNGMLPCAFSLFRARSPQEVYLWAFKNADTQAYYKYSYNAQANAA